jgi:putative membrane protein
VPGFLLRALVSAFAIWVAAAIVPGLDVVGAGTLLLAGFLLGLVNAFVRPLVIVLTFPLTLVTLGLFLWVVNAAMLALVAAMLDGMTVAGFLPALLGSLIVSLVSTAASWWVGPRGRVEVLVFEQRG